jgi:acetyl esterase/lipase
LKVAKDLRYREGDSQAWVLDMVVPENPSGALRPAIVFIHGGGWAAGSKNDAVYQDMMLNYALKGYVTINVGYRLTREAPFPACIEDVKCAVRWLRAHADEYQIDPNRIGAYGHSAGAHLALMLAVCPAEAGLEGDGGWDTYSSRINMVIAGSPPTELGREVPGMSDAKYWPIGYITPAQPPMMLIQGTADPIVREPLTTDYVDKMKAAGNNTVEYLLLEGGTHDVSYSTRLEVTAPAMEAFFAKYLK